MAIGEAIIRDFIVARSRLDPKELSSYFCEDCITNKMPIAVGAGRVRIEAFIARFLAWWATTEWDALNIKAEGNVVFAERLGRTRIADKDVHLPCGAFRMENGKTKVWRDNFYTGAYARAAGG